MMTCTSDGLHPRGLGPHSNPARPRSGRATLLHPHPSGGTVKAWQRPAPNPPASIRHCAATARLTAAASRWRTSAASGTAAGTATRPGRCELCGVRRGRCRASRLASCPIGCVGDLAAEPSVDAGRVAGRGAAHGGDRVRGETVMRRQVSTTARRTQLAALLAAVVAAQDSEPGGTRRPREGETDGDDLRVDGATRPR
jgi:hypothetical protein